MKVLLVLPWTTDLSTIKRNAQTVHDIILTAKPMEADVVRGGGGQGRAGLEAFLTVLVVDGSLLQVAAERGAKATYKLIVR
jgi:hypothetical protein